MAFGSVISACSRAGQWPAAMHLLGEMSGRKVAPGIISFNAACSACERGGQWQLALSILAGLLDHNPTLGSVLHMKKGLTAECVRADVVTFSCALLACQAASHWRQALGVFAALRAARINPSAVTCCAAVAACTQGLRLRDVAELLVEVEHLGVKAASLRMTSVAAAPEPKQRLRERRGSCREAGSYNRRHRKVR
ncbi:unnamed protein product, partial [Polarella glacialis]